MLNSMYLVVASNKVDDKEKLVYVDGCVGPQNSTIAQKFDS